MNEFFRICNQFADLRKYLGHDTKTTDFILNFTSAYLYLNPFAHRTLDTNRAQQLNDFYNRILSMDIMTQFIMVDFANVIRNRYFMLDFLDTFLAKEDVINGLPPDLMPKYMKIYTNLNDNPQYTIDFGDFGILLAFFRMVLNLYTSPKQYYILIIQSNEYEIDSQEYNTVLRTNCMWFSNENNCYEFESCHQSIKNETDDYVLIMLYFILKNSGRNAFILSHDKYKFLEEYNNLVRHYGRFILYFNFLEQHIFSLDIYSGDTLDYGYLILDSTVDALDYRSVGDYNRLEFSGEGFRTLFVQA